MGSAPGHQKTLAVHEFTREFSTQLGELLHGEPVTVLAAALEEVAMMESRVVSLLKSGEVPMEPGMGPAIALLGYGSLGYDNSGGTRRPSSDDISFRPAGHRRRRQQYSWSKIASDTTDQDGHAWRKYGQKVINGYKYPRSYFKCANSKDGGCHARRQVQLIEEDPSKYLITYIGDHSCKDHIGTVAPILIGTASTVEGLESSLISLQPAAAEILVSTSPASCLSSYYMLADPTSAEWRSMPIPIPATQGATGAVGFDHSGETSSGFSSYMGGLDMGGLGDTGSIDEMLSFDPGEFFQDFNGTQFPPC